MKCEIIRDLFPSYIEELTSNESNFEINEHIKTCEECQSILNQMQADVAGIDTKNIELNKEKIKPFKKLNKKIFQSIVATLTVCILIVCGYFYFFAIGWGVESKDVKVQYSYQDESIVFNFELTNGRALNAWTDYKNPQATIKFTQCFNSIFDDIGNEFSYGFREENEKGEMKTFTDKDRIVLKFKDKEEILNLKEIAQELQLQ